MNFLRAGFSFQKKKEIAPLNRRGQSVGAGHSFRSEPPSARSSPLVAHIEKINSAARRPLRAADGEKQVL